MKPDLCTFFQDTIARRNWGHGGLLVALRGVKAAEAGWKPDGRAHSIWEEVNHIAYWSRYCLRRLEGEKVSARQAWPRGGHGTQAWEKTLREVEALHERLSRQIQGLDEHMLASRLPGSQYTLGQALLGCVAHVSYHIGQIRLLRRLYRAGRKRHGGKT